MKEFGQSFIIISQFQQSISRKFLQNSYLVTTNSSGLKSFGRKLFVFVRDKMNAERKLVNSSLFTTQIENPDFGIGDTTTKPRFWVRFVLTIAITSRWTTSHLEILCEFKIRFDTGTTRAKRKLCWWKSVLPYIWIWWHFLGPKNWNFFTFWT